MSYDNVPESEKCDFSFSQEEISPIVKAYKIRWVILVIYVVFAAISTFQWVQHSVISEILVKYYDVSATLTEWGTLMCVIVWPVILFPISFLVEKKGIRKAALIGCCATALGSVLKVFSVSRNLFFVLLTGQTIITISQMFIMTLPAKIAATWFKSSEVSIACALGIFGLQLGRSLGVTVPPFIVHNHTKTDDIGADLVALRNSIAGAILPVAFILFLYYPKRPDHAPSHVQLEERQNGEPVTIGVYLESLKVLFTNKSFLLQMLIYGIGIGISFALGTCLNQIVRNNFEDSKDSDKIIIVMIVAGMVGCICMGLILDRTHKYKETSFALFLASAIGMAVLLFAIKFKSKFLIYFSTIVFGFLLNGYMPAGIEFAIELTFPSPESAVIGVLLTVSHLFGIVISIALREINTEFGTLWTVFSLVVVLLIETLLTYLIPNRLRRQDAFENIHSEEGSLQNDLLNKSLEIYTIDELENAEVSA